MTEKFRFHQIGVKSSQYPAERLKVEFMAEVRRQMVECEVSNAELARRLSASPAYVAKLFRGPANVSAETMAKLATALHCQVHIHLAQRDATVRWFDVLKGSRPQVAETSHSIWQGEHLTHFLDAEVKDGKAVALAA